MFLYFFEWQLFPVISHQGEGLVCCFCCDCPLTIVFRSYPMVGWCSASRHHTDPQLNSFPTQPPTQPPRSHILHLIIHIHIPLSPNRRSPPNLRSHILHLIQHLCQNTTFHNGQTSGATVSDILESSHICHTHTLSHKCSHNCETRTTPVTLPRYSPGVSQQWSFNEYSLSIFNSTVHFQLRIVTNQYHMAVSQILATIWDEIFKYNLLKNMLLAP